MRTCAMRTHTCDEKEIAKYINPNSHCILANLLSEFIIQKAASVAQWFSAVDFPRRRWRMAVGSSPIHGRLHTVQRPLISPSIANAAHERYS